MKDLENHYIGKHITDDYDEYWETKLLGGCLFNMLGFIIALLLCCIFGAFFSCSRVEYITETVKVHDTLRAVSRDTIVHTVREHTIVNVKDSVSHVEFVRGDTVFIKDYRIINNEIRTEINDSLLKSITDSISKSFAVNNDKETIVPEPTKRRLSFFDRLYNSIENIVIWTIIFIVLMLSIKTAVKNDWIGKFISMLKKLK